LFLCLADAFKELNSDIQLELKVKVFNINHSKNHKILSKCQSLSDYSTFVKYAMEAQRNKNPNFIRYAINRCIKENVMVNYLENLSQEDCNMIFGDYDYATDIRVQREEAKEEGINETKIANAKAFITLGKISLEDIANCCGLSLEQVQKLADSNK